jgi:hypothetical protein
MFICRGSRFFPFVSTQLSNLGADLADPVKKPNNSLSVNTFRMIRPTDLPFPQGFPHLVENFFPKNVRLVTYDVERGDKIRHFNDKYTTFGLFSLNFSDDFR